MPRHDRTRAVSKRPARWPSDQLLHHIVNEHWLLFDQLQGIFGSRLACEMVVASAMRVRL